MRFPPLSFVRFENSSILKGDLAMLNRSHAFASWLLDAARDLADRFPANFIILISSELLERSCREWDPVVCMNSVNAGLQRLSQLDPGMAPRQTALLTRKDFGI